MTHQTLADRLQGTTERRSVDLTDFEMRADGNTLKFRGYASLFGVGYDMYGGPDKGGFVEEVDRKAFDRTLAAKPDVVLNMNHGQAGTGLPIARTTSGTLQLRTDTKGLLPEADLDLRDPDVQALQVKVERGDVNQMSFAFRTIRQEWNDEDTQRTLLELSLDRGDVSIVTNGANPKTSLQLRDFVHALAQMDPAQAQKELRALDAMEMPMVQQANSLLGSLLDMNTPTEDVEPDDDDGGNGKSGATPSDYSGTSEYSEDNMAEWRADKYNADDRKKMAKSGEAMPDGSYPIKDSEDLQNAIHAVGRGGSSHDAIRKHIIARAKALGLSDRIPSDWNSDGSIKGNSMGRSLIVPDRRLSVAHARRLAVMDAA